MSIDHSATDEPAASDGSPSPAPARAGRILEEVAANGDFAAAMSEAFAFWLDEAEDVYGPEDGEPL